MKKPIVFTTQSADERLLQYTLVAPANEVEHRKEMVGEHRRYWEFAAPLVELNSPGNLISSPGLLLRRDTPLLRLYLGYSHCYVELFFLGSSL